MWVVQAKFGGFEGPDAAWQDAILQISADGKFTVVSGPHHRALSSLITDTLFWMDAYAGRDNPQNLEIGEYWGRVMTNILYVRSIDIGTAGDASAQVATVGYDGRKESHVKILDGFPFPIEAKVYTPLGGTAIPQLDYSIRLLDYRPGPGDHGHDSAQPHTDTRNSDQVFADGPGLQNLTDNLEWIAEIISESCEAGLENRETDPRVSQLCTYALSLRYGPPEDAGYAGADPEPARFDPHRRHCTGSLIEEMCFEGVVASVGDAALRVGERTVRLSLVGAGAEQEEPPHGAASARLESECAPGSWAAVDIDDLQPIDINGNSMGAVYCQDEIPINAILLHSGTAPADTSQCGSSEFASHNWAGDVCDR